MFRAKSSAVYFVASGFNIDISKVKYRRNYLYTKKFLSKCIQYNFEIVEIHNRPESLIYLLNQKLICQPF